MKYLGVSGIKILALESSAKAASAAVCEDGKIIGQNYQNCGLTHSKTLLPMVDALLSGCGLTVGDMDLIAVAKGPGSFTGVRIGVAAAKGLAWGADKPCCGVSTLEAMAWQLSFMSDIAVCAVMDARRGQVYNALFETEDGRPVRLCEDRAVSIEQLFEDVKKIKKSCFLVGDGAELCYNHLGQRNLPLFLAPEHLRWQSAWAVARAAEYAEAVPASGLVPVYLRLSQAEREKLERERQKKNIKE